jgi:lipopolysaccharide O-acetyltransferase
MRRKYSIFSFFYLGLCFLYTKIFFFKARLIRLPFFLYGKNRFLYGRKLTLGKHNRIDIFYENNSYLNIGNNVQLNDYNHIACMKSIIIGDDVLIGSRVSIIDHDHGIYKGNKNQSLPNSKAIDREYFCSDVSIGNNVWVGDGVIILPGTKIGDNCIVGAGSVLKNNYPRNTMIVGNPARIVKKYDFKLKQWKKIKS